MTRLFTLALIVMALASCHDGVLHWLTPIPPLPSVEPDMDPKAYPIWLPTITPEPSAYPCSRWHVWDCELHFSAREL